MRISELSDQTNTPVDTIRYYEKIALLPEAKRSGSGYRQYDEESVNLLAFIASAKKLGMSLDDIKALLAIELDKSAASCETVKGFIAKQLRLVEEKMFELQRIEKAMRRLHDTCCGGAESADYCSILQALERGDV